jgi:hypothetical protein
MNIITGNSPFGRKKKGNLALGKKSQMNGKRIIRNAQKYFEKNPTYIREEDIALN